MSEFYGEPDDPGLRHHPLRPSISGSTSSTADMYGIGGNEELFGQTTQP